MPTGEFLSGRSSYKLPANLVVGTWYVFSASILPYVSRISMHHIRVVVVVNSVAMKTNAMMN